MKNESLRMRRVRGIQRRLAASPNGGSLAVPHHGGHQEFEPGVTVLFVVPGEELPAEVPGILDGAEGGPSAVSGAPRSITHRRSEG